MALPKSQPRNHFDGATVMTGFRSLLAECLPDAWRLNNQTGPYRTTTTRPPITIADPFEMPSDVRGLEDVLQKIMSRKSLDDTVRRQVAEEVLANFISALAAGRASNRVTLMLLGQTGQGKSATINKLVGQQILKTGRNKSTTKDITSAKVYAIRNGIKLAVAFDDTPGLNDTRIADRERNAATLLRYRQSFTSSSHSTRIDNLLWFLQDNGHGALADSLEESLRQEVYPNAILLTAKWENIKDEGDNPAGQLTTAMGQTIQALHHSRLYDHRRPNVIIVVTKAIFSPKGDLGKNYDAEWKFDADEKCGFVHHIQRLIFPGAVPWPVVFVENGSDRDSFGTYDFFPDGKQTHQNLFDELFALFSQTHGRDGLKDLLGLQALAAVIAGTAPHIQMDVEAEPFVGDTVKQGSLQSRDNLDQDSRSDNLPTLASKVLGRPYNPFHKRLGKSSLVDIAVEDIQVVQQPGTTFDVVLQARQGDMNVGKSQLGIEYDIRMPPPSHMEAGSPDSEMVNINAFHVAAIASVDNDLQVSELAMQLIETLPPWDEHNEHVRSSYSKFFDQNGTHLLVAAALGGRITLKGCEQSGFDLHTVISVLRAGTTGASGRRPGCEGVDEIEIRVAGGGVSRDMIDPILRGLLHGSLSSLAYEEWSHTRAGWVEALSQDSIFLHHLPQTKYKWFHDTAGLTAIQQANLSRAARWYLEDRPEPPSPPSPSPPANTNLQRANNAIAVDRIIEEEHVGFWEGLAINIAAIAAKCVIQ